VPFTTIEVLNNRNDIPYIQGRDDLIISISHEKEYAVAVAIKVKNESGIS
jgi:phosphopantetheinyl transferase (holo-ACP synthase)